MRQCSIMMISSRLLLLLAAVLLTSSTISAVASKKTVAFVGCYDVGLHTTALFQGAPNMAPLKSGGSKAYTPLSCIKLGASRALQHTREFGPIKYVSLQKQGVACWSFESLVPDHESMHLRDMSEAECTGPRTQRVYHVLSEELYKALVHVEGGSQNTSTAGRGLKQLSSSFQGNCPYITPQAQLGIVNSNDWNGVCVLTSYLPSISPWIQTPISMVGNTMGTSGNVDYCSATSLIYIMSMIVYNYGKGNWLVNAIAITWSNNQVTYIGGCPAVSGSSAIWTCPQYCAGVNMGTAGNPGTPGTNNNDCWVNTIIMGTYSAPTIVTSLVMGVEGSGGTNPGAANFHGTLGYLEVTTTGGQPAGWNNEASELPKLYNAPVGSGIACGVVYNQMATNVTAFGIQFFQPIQSVSQSNMHLDVSQLAVSNINLGLSSWAPCATGAGTKVGTQTVSATSGTSQSYATSSTTTTSFGWSVSAEQSVTATAVFVTATSDTTENVSSSTTTTQQSSNSYTTGSTSTIQSSYNLICPMTIWNGTALKAGDCCIFQVVQSGCSGASNAFTANMIYKLTNIMSNGSNPLVFFGTSGYSSVNSFASQGAVEYACFAAPTTGQCSTLPLPTASQWA